MALFVIFRRNQLNILAVLSLVALGRKKTVLYAFVSLWKEGSKRSQYPAIRTVLSLNDSEPIKFNLAQNNRSLRAYVSERLEVSDKDE